MRQDVAASHGVFISHLTTALKVLFARVLKLFSDYFFNFCFRRGFIKTKPAGPRWGSSRRSPDSLVVWGGDTPPHSPSHITRRLRRSILAPSALETWRLWRLDLCLCAPPQCKTRL